MSHPEEEILAAVAIDEQVDPTILEHVQDCEQCTTAVASLRSTLQLARAGDAEPRWTAPPTSVWDAVMAAVDAPTAAREPLPAPEPATPVAPPVALDAVRSDRRPSRRTLLWAGGAAAAGLVVGIVGTRIIDDRSSTPSPVAVVPLDTLDTHKTLGQAQVLWSGSAVDLRIETEPLQSDGGYLEVWLINSDLKRMVSVGVLRNGQRTATFPISREMIDAGYVIVDISREGFDDKPQHSGDSVVRGKLPI